MIATLANALSVAVRALSVWPSKVRLPRKASYLSSCFYEQLQQCRCHVSPSLGENSNAESEDLR